MSIVRTRSVITLILALLLLTTSSAGVVAQETAPQPPDASHKIPDAPSLESLKRLDVNLGYEPNSIDPSLAADAASFEVVRNLFTTLTRVDSSGIVLPELATSWSVSPDGRTYTFVLRSDASWVRYHPATGTTTMIGPVTAQDVAYAVRRACDPRTGSDYVYVDYIIAGCQDLNTADLSNLTPAQIQALIDAVGVEAPNANTVRFRLHSKAPYFPAIAGMWVNAPLPQAAIGQYGNQWTESGNIVTNGPYVLTEWQHDDYLSLLRNPAFRSGQTANIENVRVWMHDSGYGLAYYQADELDTLVQPQPITGSAELVRELHIAPNPCTYYYGFTTTKPPLNNVLVRKALSAAIDRTQFSRWVWNYTEPANSFAPPGIFGTTAFDTAIAHWALPESRGGTGYTAALHQARQWLAQAGYPGGAGFPTIRLMYNTSETHARIARAVVDNWRSGLGINVTVEMQDWQTYLNTIQNTTPLELMPHVWRLGWCSDYPDQNNWAHEVFNTNAGENRPRWQAEANAPLGPGGMSFNQLTSAAQQTTNPTQRSTLYRDAEKILSETAAPYAPIYYYTTLDLTKPWLQRTYETNWGQRFNEWEDISSLSEIASGGGVLVSSDAVVTANIPAGTFPSGSYPVTMAYLPRSPMPGNNGLAATPYAFEVLAYDQAGVTIQPAGGRTFTIQVDYDEATLGPVSDESSLALYYWSNSRWNREPTSQADTANNRITATPLRFARWAVFGSARSTFLPMIAERYERTP